MLIMDIKLNGVPQYYEEIKNDTLAAKFNMASDVDTCSLLRTLAKAKSGRRYLELGTGTGLSTAWILDGIDKDAVLISIDNDPDVLNIADKYLSGDPRLTLVREDGFNWIEKNQDQKFDFIFADTWPGKYYLLAQTLNMLNQGGIYFIDDMKPQANWPEGHDLKVAELTETLNRNNGVFATHLDWATGIIIVVKI